MKQDVEFKYQIIDIENKGFLLEDQGFLFLQDVKNQIDRALSQSVEKIIFLQREDVSDNIADWELHSKTGLMLKVVLERILFIRSLFNTIRSMSHVFTYVGKGHCLGGFWELALCCEKRIWFGHEGFVGFPALGFKLYPFGGSLEGHRKKKYLSRNFWEADFEFPIQKALEISLVDVLLSQEIAQDYILLYLSKCKEDLIHRDLEGHDSSRYHRLPWDRLIQLEKSWISSKRIHNISSSWDFAWIILKTKKWFENEQEFENLFSYFLAKFYLQDNLKVLSNSQRKYGIANVAQRKKVVYIDSKFWAPPLASVINILNNGYKVIFFGANSNAISILIERIFSKIERLSNKNEIYQKWNESVSWFHGEDVDPSNVTLHWTIGDNIEVKYKGVDYFFYNLESNLLDSEVGFLEGLNNVCITQKNSTTLENILNIISKGVIEEYVVGDNIPLSCWVRLMFLQEMIQCSGLMNASDIFKVMTSLGHKGWRFASSVSRWEYFLQTRRGSPDDSSDIVFPMKEVWDLGRLKYSQSLIEVIDTNVYDWNSTQISNHFALYAYVLSKYLASLNFFDNPNDAELLVNESIGFPLDLGSPSSFFKYWGCRRSQLYIEKFWNNLIG